MKDIDALVDKTMEALGFTQDQTREELRASLMEARALGLEEAAKACEETVRRIVHVSADDAMAAVWVICATCAKNVRALNGE